MINRLMEFTGLALSDLLGHLPERGSLEAHRKAGEAWLKLAHEKSPDDGVSYGYSLRGGWRPSYRETSGYIATTFFDLAHHYNNDDWRDRAERVSRWLLSVQNSDGSFANPNYGEDGIVFDTGQDLFGLVRAFEETGDEAFKLGAARAADWLVRVADDQGHWTRYEHLNTPHVYNSRTAWAVLRMNQVEQDSERERVARANLDWAVNCQQDNGFFDHCAFVTGDAPFTHNIAYVTRGLLESAEILGDERYLEAAVNCARASAEMVADDGFLPGQITVDGQSAASYCCLTGNCQFAIIWAKLFDKTGDEFYKNAAIRVLDYVMARQDIVGSNINVRGAIKGSFPIWGRYSRMTYPNWPTKFFVDAMLLRCRWD